MDNKCTAQIFVGGAWRDAAVISLAGPEHQGWRTPTYTTYLPDYALDYLGRRDAAACGVRFPVSLEIDDQDTWPAWLLDVLPQGYGRQELLRQLDLPATVEASGDWPLLRAGAGNPIGNLRIKEAWDWLAEGQAGPARGFHFDEVAGRHEDFVEHLAGHGLFVAGSSGVQGEWPKILLTEADDGLLYLDHTLEDSRARRHWLVKFQRGTDRDLEAILRAEAPYMALARALGLRVHGALEMHGRTLFIPRFDRGVDGGGVQRIAQESLASLCGRAGFGLGLQHEDACRALAEVVTDPQTEIIEYLKRDVANLALGNKDNHARNTAIARYQDGRIALTPVFDFAPMFLHPDGIARQSRWQADNGGQPDWQDVTEALAAAGNLEAGLLRRALRDMAPCLRGLPQRMGLLGVDADLVARLRPGILKLADQLERLHG